MNKKRLHPVLAFAVLALSLLLVGSSFFVSSGPADTEAAARALGERVERRLAVLDGYMARALETDRESWMSLEDLPEDMVVYRYLGDTLQSWAHQFPIVSDDIRLRTVVPRLGSSRSPLLSPLAEVTGKPGYYSFGPKWYIARSEQDGDCLVIGGLEMTGEPDGRGSGGVNPRLRISPRFSLQPLSAGTGASVQVGGVPLLKIVSETVEPVRVVSNYLLFWLGVGLFLLGTLLLLYGRRTLLRYFLALFLQAVMLAGVYFYGMFVQGASKLFSPVLYADGPVLYSLGAVLVINILLTLAVFSTFLVSRTILRHLVRRRSRLRLALALTLLLCVAAGLLVYIHLTFRSIVLNSVISLELYKIGTLSPYTALVYLSYFLLALTLPLLLQMAVPAFRRLFGLRYDAFSRTGRFLFAVLAALYFTVASSVLGFRKERSRVDVWSNRLAMDRDISLEIQLRSVEGAIAADPVIAAVAALQNSNGLIQNRLADTYMSRLSQDYDILVINLAGAENNTVLLSLLSSRIAEGTRIAENSRFYYSRDMSGRARYAGVFSYYTRYGGPVDLLLGIESKSNREDRGYLSLLGIAEPGRIAMPVNYSYAKYVSDRLVSFNGNYGYPTLIPESIRRLTASHERGSLQADGYTHFVHAISDDETVVISRERTDRTGYGVEWVLFAIAAYFLISLVTLRWRRTRRRERSYYRTRITAVLYAALTLTLVTMAIFSVYFVYRRNDKDMRAMMSSKINAIQAMVQSRLRQTASPQELRGQEVMGALEYTADVLKSDITLYSPSGRVLLTTTPEIFERMIIGRRLHEDALYNIVYGHQRYYIHREQLSSHRLYTLYAPVFGNDGGMLAIVSSPYTDQNYDLETEAASHIATILTLFLLLLILARFLTTAVITRMFKPLSEMSAKMNVADIDHLEYIVYDQDDEITSLVTAYNRMVRDLSDSTRALAQAERDKAWSGMARQVAHEIKNPLTPIKLQLQMIIRMKQSGNPAWESKFDEVAGVVLEHIDILADTANEFSTFAKLYSEDPVPIDLDALIRDEVTMFSGREGVDVSYFGLSGARIEGPKPQLTRVLVNLITNSVQAVELMQEAEAAEGTAVKRGIVHVSLRNSTRDGFYDIVVEDNGPGVPEEYRSRLFTPNFTTKSGGTGLGLAISRTVVERCKGEIFYGKSFSLGGASFTIRYPKP